MIEGKATRALACSVLLALSLTGAAQAQRAGYTRQISLPQGTVLRAELNDNLSSTDSRPGDRFTATVRSDRDGSQLPSGTEVIGRVAAVRRASDRQPGVLDVDFTSLRTPEGRTYAIDGSLVDLNSKSVRRTSDGRLEATGSSSSRDKNKFIGYGAAAGAIIGALSDNNLLTSGLLGAAAGWLYGEVTKDKQRSGRYSDVSLKEGTEFGVALDQQIALAVPADRYTDPYDRTDLDARNTRRAQRRLERREEQRAGSLEPYNDRDIRVFVNDREVRFGEARPYMSGSRLMVPAGTILDEAGYRWNYDSRSQELTVRGDRGDARLRLGDSYTTVDGERVRLDTPALRHLGEVYVPVQFLEEATDIRSSWDASGRTLRMSTRSRASLPYDSDYYRTRAR